MSTFYQMGTFYNYDSKTMFQVFHLLIFVLHFLFSTIQGIKGITSNIPSFI